MDTPASLRRRENVVPSGIRKRQGHWWGEPGASTVTPSRGPGPEVGVCGVSGGRRAQGTTSLREPGCGAGPAWQAAVPLTEMQ